MEKDNLLYEQHSRVGKRKLRQLGLLNVVNEATPFAGHVQATVGHV